MLRQRVEACLRGEHILHGVGVALEVAHVPPFFLEPKKTFCDRFHNFAPMGFLQGLLLKGFYGGCFAAGVRMRYFWQFAMEQKWRIQMN